MKAAINMQRDTNQEEIWATAKKETMKNFGILMGRMTEFCRTKHPMRKTGGEIIRCNGLFPTKAGQAAEILPATVAATARYPHLLRIANQIGAALRHGAGGNGKRTA